MSCITFQLKLTNLNLNRSGPLSCTLNKELEWSSFTSLFHNWHQKEQLYSSICDFHAKLQPAWLYTQQHHDLSSYNSGILPFFFLGYSNLPCSFLYTWANKIIWWIFPTFKISHFEEPLHTRKLKQWGDFWKSPDFGISVLIIVVRSKAVFNNYATYHILSLWLSNMVH